MSDFFAALALVLVIEGLLYAAFVDQMKGMLKSFLDLSSSTIRVAGLGVAGLGLILLWTIRG